MVPISGDMISTYMTTPYRNGVYMTDGQIASMCIALLMAGQHTSSTTASWLGFYLMLNANTCETLIDEVDTVMNGMFSNSILKNNSSEKNKQKMNKK